MARGRGQGWWEDGPQGRTGQGTRCLREGVLAKERRLGRSQVWPGSSDPVTQLQTHKEEAAGEAGPTGERGVQARPSRTCGAGALQRQRAGWGSAYTEGMSYQLCDLGPVTSPLWASRSQLLMGTDTMEPGLSLNTRFWARWFSRVGILGAAECGAAALASTCSMPGAPPVRRATGMVTSPWWGRGRAVSLPHRDPRLRWWPEDS